MQKVVCENSRGEKIDFFSDDSPVEVISLDGFSDIEYTVNTTQNSGQDGEKYAGSQAQKRNPVIVGTLKGDFRKQRDRLYSFFQPRATGTVYYWEDESDAGRKAQYYVESIQIENYGVRRDVTLSLICPDPKWYALDEQLTQLSRRRGLITFPLRLSNPFKVSEIVKSLIANIYNSSAVPMGLTVKFMASGTVTNPSLYDINRQQLMQINTTMHVGDIIAITTADGNKRVRLISGGVTSNINNLMTYPPHWLQAQQGDNLYRYNADSGIDSLSVAIKSMQAYWGA